MRKNDFLHYIWNSGTQENKKLCFCELQFLNKLKEKSFAPCFAISTINQKPCHLVT
jgi:hypothetical protein